MLLYNDMQKDMFFFRSEEIYFVADELRNASPGLAFKQVSYCAGILTLTH